MKIFTKILATLETSFIVTIHGADGDVNELLS